MEFLQFLQPIELELINIVKKSSYKIEENSSLCKLSKDYVGLYEKKKKTIIICTDNAKSRENYNPMNSKQTGTFERTAIHIKKALRHELIHVAQDCNDGKLLDLKNNYSMNPAKIKALKGSLKISNEEEKERQAYILEDKPRLVKKELERYCL